MSQQMPYNPYTAYPYTEMYPSSTFPFQMGQPGMPGTQQVTPMQPSGSMIPGTPLAPGQVVEESYIENILRLNRGKVITVYQTFENNTQWNAKIFRGVLETAGRDHIILSDPQTGKRFLLLMVNTDYITADEELNYIPPSLAFGTR
ncbi:spore coat protein GerQ [Brevibacillus composti]|uniref:Spore coat protein GerQ n=1 Tax=Brevibacillus composti TaxID=2796470 RepID=A0A7T5JMK8_9BACL|nr:spore coat protein GerQ [Brevibacillus composti]QQE73376.1 spore coat protein GerQ [Brevibacillus composti]QQE73468.1 spore coat protein GerQ [Brevibacillus composti]QUO40457.1 spore coat protein GerQ [Brevibacillus composti]QUO40550.1 spore coat protein GerQ [Brevibacillus composti]